MYTIILKPFSEAHCLQMEAFLKKTAKIRIVSFETSYDWKTVTVLTPSRGARDMIELQFGQFLG